MARTVADARLLFDVLAPVARRSGGVRVGICRDLDPVGLSPAIATVLESLPLSTVELRAPGLPDACRALAATVSVEVLRVHRAAGLWPWRAAEYAPDVPARLVAAEAVSEEAFRQAQRDRQRVRSIMTDLLRQVDVLLTPVSGVQPIAVDAPTDAVFRAQVMSGTASQSLTGLPACVFRAGTDDGGLPVGLQLTAALNREHRLLDVAEYLHVVQSPW
jgi:aspartyl-tRNA(Asn)/glutamyl-tRNA(Gln) amidotransferase subunit A